MANAVAGALVALGRMLAPLITNFSGDLRTCDANGRPLPGPSVEAIQAEADREARERAAASAQQIQEAIAKTGVWFPGRD